MTKVQVNLNEEENKILEAFRFIYGEENKTDALKKIIIRLGELDNKIKEALKLRGKI